MQPRRVGPNLLALFSDMLIRFAINFAAVATFTVVLSAQTAAPTTAAAAGGLPPELQAELDALQSAVWQPTAQVRASLGWRDNVLLSPFAPIERAFVRGEVEAMLWRPMHNRWEFLSFLNADVLRYFPPPVETGGEQQWSLHLEERWRAADSLRVSLKATGYQHDMVIDLSETEATRVVAPTRVRGGFITLVSRFTLPAGFTFEPLGRVKRTDYREFAGDYDESMAGARMEWRRGADLVLSAAVFEHHRRYAERVQYTAGGRALPRTRLRFEQRVGELKAGTGWQARGDWNVTGTVGWLENRDEASGYFDYDQKKARLELGWASGPWRVTFDGETQRMEYLIQTVGAGIAPPARITDDHEVSLRLERQLDERWTLFAEYRWERSRSNELEFSYRANSALAGVQRSF